MNIMEENTVQIASGALCPENGIWKNAGRFTTTIVMAKGNRFPLYCGHKTYWNLICVQ